MLMLSGLVINCNSQRHFKILKQQCIFLTHTCSWCASTQKSATKWTSRVSDHLEFDLNQVIIEQQGLINT
jgi:hypothetical protein